MEYKLRMMLIIGGKVRPQQMSRFKIASFAMFGALESRLFPISQVDAMLPLVLTSIFTSTTTFSKTSIRIPSSWAQPKTSSSKEISSMLSDRLLSPYVTARM
jgi:hypothetical protein